MTFRVHAHSNGTHTLVDEENGQAMHSRIGPTLEANLVYAERARIEESLDGESASHVLYDVGMGTGANVIATLERIRSRPDARGRIEIFSFESKPEGLAAALANPETFPELAAWDETLRALLEKSEVRFEVGAIKVEWRLLVGDFYSRLHEASTPDSLYFDFYSPKVVPELWSLDHFTRLREKIGDHPARLFTYSAATPVRLHLFAAGFFVGAGASTGVKTETTIAATRFELLEAPLSPAWLSKLATSSSVSGPEFARAKCRAAANPQWARLGSKP